ncbi:MAG: molybdopterin-dependent oxidoreductase [Planctomycetaceae bacterium]|nr:molybdopterin-dependent oxidoreductase [Planctomycetaceae bacterium]MBV8268676.1 molybdopterin-dependent oxidoreductase [Planctomycetaceae bacterium]
MMWNPLILSLWIGLAPAPISIEPLPFAPEAWKRAAQVEVRVTEGGEPTVYSGIPLALVLDEQLRGSNRMAALRSLSDAVILVRASDGYQAAVSAAAVAMDPKGERFLLALARDGKPLGDRHGPVRLVIPGDPQRVRWVRMVASLHLVRLAPLKTTSPTR